MAGKINTLQVESLSCPPAAEEAATASARAKTCTLTLSYINETFSSIREFKRKVLPHLHSDGRPPLPSAAPVVLPHSFTQHHAVLRQRHRLPQAAPDPGRPRRPLQQTVGRAAVFGPDPRTPAVGHQLPRTPDPVQALRRVAVLSEPSGARGGVVTSSGGASPRGPVGAAQVHRVAVLLGTPKAGAGGQRAAALEVGVLGGLGAALGSHRQRRLGHARVDLGEALGLVSESALSSSPMALM
ncbi:hypothetical protein EYF80_001586 [Liparis tanakae]|uniref:Uncharacterized protein n=1 Tax=Liparis tanakae TaxID=230148 RepID=A0A4Z2JCH3_9TELE|nr:hypothetical protein EYF80_001586 [Liparis tanakae]